MKRKYLFLFLIIFLVCIQFVPVAQAEESIKEDLSVEIDDQLDELDLSEFDKFVKSLDNNFLGDSFEKIIQKIIDGEQVFTFSMIVDVLGDNLLKEMIFGLPICASIILICVLSTTLSRFSSKISVNATENVVRFVCFSAILILLVSSLYSLADNVKNTISTLSSFMNIIFPVIVTMLTVIGGGASVGLFSPYLAILSSLVVNGLNGVIIPLFFACVTLSVVGCLSDSVKLDGIRKFLKTFCDWLLGLGFGVFCTFLGGQSVLTGGLDNISIKATKFALSSYVPILGGYLSDGFDVVLAGSMLIKNAIGITGIFVILLILVVPVLKLVVFSLLLKLTSGITQTIGDQKISNLLAGVSSTITMLVTFLLGVAFVFFFVVILMIYSVNAGVL